MKAPSETQFSQLKQDVYALVRAEAGSLKADTAMKIKCVGYTLGVFLSYFYLMVFQPTGFAMGLNLTLLSFTMMGLLVNVLHDVMHGAVSESPFFKNYFCYLADWMGASSIVWKNKHNNSHHIFTNNAMVDNDLNVSSVLRFTDQHPLKRINRWQHFYILPAYTLHTPFWFYVSDFRNVIRRRITTHPLLGFTRKEQLMFIANKGVHLIFALGLPIFIFGLKNALLGYAYVYGLAGLLLAIIFQVGHVFENARYHHREKFESIDDWVKVQIESTTNFAPRSKIAFWCYGGLNNQIMHHLFPEICHTHYEVMRPLVRAYCNKNGIRFHEVPSLRVALWSHLKQIKLLGRSTFVSDVLERETGELHQQF